MSRRNQSTRRRSYGRRQHEVRERRPELETEDAWVDTELEAARDWHTPDAADEGGAYGKSFGGYAR